MLVIEIYWNIVGLFHSLLLSGSMTDDLSCLFSCIWTKEISYWVQELEWTSDWSEEGKVQVLCSPVVLQKSKQCRMYQIWVDREITWWSGSFYNLVYNYCKIYDMQLHYVTFCLSHLQDTKTQAWNANSRKIVCRYICDDICWSLINNLVSIKYMWWHMQKFDKQSCFCKIWKKVYNYVREYGENIENLSV